MTKMRTTTIGRRRVLGYGAAATAFAATAMRPTGGWTQAAKTTPVNLQIGWITGGNQLGSRLATDTTNRYFELELALDAGEYQFKITGKSAADAAVSAIPEPSSILLLGIGLLGLCSGLRRARKQV